MTPEQQAQDDWWKEMGVEQGAALHIRLVKAIVRVGLASGVDPNVIRRAAAVKIMEWAALLEPAELAQRHEIYTRVVDETFAEAPPSEVMLVADRTLLARSQLANEAVRIKGEARAALRSLLGQVPVSQIREKAAKFLARSAAEPGRDPKAAEWHARVIMEVVDCELRLFEERARESI